jgi:hypothetical protein
MFRKEKRKKKIENRVGNEKRFSLSNCIYFLLFIFYSVSSNAQCAMCRAALESEGDTAKGEAINNGIVYLMAIPYLLVAVIGFVVYKMFVKKKVKE